MMTGTLSTFIKNGWDVGTIWQKCQGAVSAINQIAKLSKLLPINHPNSGSISLSIPQHNSFFTSFLWLKSFSTTLTNQYEHTANLALGIFYYSFIHLKVRSV